MKGATTLKKLHLFIITYVIVLIIAPFSVSAAEERLITFDGIEITHEQKGFFFDEIPYTRLNNETVLAKFQSKEQLAYYEPIIKKSPFVLYVEENTTRTIEENIVQDIATQNQWWKSKIDALHLDEFKDIAKHPVKIAVIDSGVDTHHESLQNVILPYSYDFTTNSYEVVDYLGHGTAIAGIIAATNNNPYAIQGTADGFPVYVLALRIMDDQGRTKISQIVEAIDYAISQDVQIINLSFGGEIPVWSEKRAIEKAREAGIIVVASAGNTAMLGNPINYPANYEGVIAVGATNEQNQRARFSNYHPYVAFTAPGTSILTTTPNHQYQSLNGTSFSTPMVSSLLGMLLSIEPSLTEEQLIQILRTSSIDLSGKGKDEHFGFGLIQVAAALEEMKQLPKWKVTPLRKEVQLDQPIPSTIETIQQDEYGILLEQGSDYFSGVLPLLRFSTNPGVATVDPLGHIHAHQYGQTTITLYLTDQQKITFQVKVAPNTQNKIALFSDKPVEWASNNVKVASVDPYGIVTFNQSGTATIYAKYHGLEKAVQLSAYSLQPDLESETFTPLLGHFTTTENIHLLFNDDLLQTGTPAITLSFDKNGDQPFTNFTITYKKQTLILQPKERWPKLPLYIHFDNLKNHKGEPLYKKPEGHFTFYSLNE